MIRNYNFLGVSRDTTLKNRKVEEVGETTCTATSTTKKPSIYFGWLVAFLLVFGLKANAQQVSQYTMAESTEAYAQITGTTSTATGDDGTQQSLPIGFSFNYGGVAYTTFSITTNGMIKLGSAIVTGIPNYTNDMGTGSQNRPYIAAFWDDNNLGGGTIRYSSVGGVLSVNWHNTNIGGGGLAAGGTVSYTIRLIQATGVIEIVYGSPFTTTNTCTAAVGLNDMVSFLSVTPAAVSTTSNVTANNGISAAVAANLAGKKLTFTPPPPLVCPIPTGITVTAVTPTTATVSWTGAATAVVEWGASGCAGGTTSSAGACGNVVLGSSPQTITGLALGSAYTVHVRQNCTGTGNGYSPNGTVAYNHTGGESCGLATPITVYPNVGASVNTLLTMGLTSDGPNGTCSDATGNPSKKDTWAKFVAPSSGNKLVIFCSSGSITDAVMQVWSSCPATGTAIGCNDDSNGLMPVLNFCQNQYTPGATYYVQVWPYSATATGNFNIKIYEETSCPLPPTNDDCAGVQTITVGASGACPTGTVNGTTVNATSSPGIVKTTCDQFATYYDVIYKFNTGSSTSIHYDFTNLTGTNHFGLYSGCGTTYMGVCSFGTASGNFTGLTAGTDYYIIVYATTVANTGNFSICLSLPPAPGCVTSPTTPADGSTTVDSCNAVTLSWPAVTDATGYDVYMDIGFGPATTLVSPPNNTATSLNVGVLQNGTSYSWRVVPKNNSGSAVGCNDFSFMTTTAVVPSCVASPTAPVNASTICGGLTNFSWPAVSGANAYDVYVDNILVSNNQVGTTYSQSLGTGAHTWKIVPSSCLGDATGCATFTFTSTPAPAGDSFATAIDLGAVTSTLSVNGENASANCWHDDYTTTSTPGDATAHAGNDVFYKLQITCAGTIDFSTCSGTMNDTYIHLLNASGGHLTSDDDSCTAPNGLGSSITGFAVTPGTYYIIVEGFNATYQGTYTLDISTTPTTACSSIVNLKLFVEGYYNSATGLMKPVNMNQGVGVSTTDVETITVELHNATAPYALAATTTAMLKTNGTVSSTFNTAPSGSFYVVVKTRNAIETWSATPLTVGASPLTYDFSTAATQAYGSNMVDMNGSGTYGLYSGDIDPAHDGNVDTIDYPVWETDSNNFESGIFLTDLNGDGNVDTIDYPIWETNSNGFISVIRP